MLQYPEASHKLLGWITDICIDLLVAQWQAGASILQVRLSTHGSWICDEKMRKLMARIIRKVCIDTPASPSIALQVFESHAGELSPSQFKTFALPYLRRIAAGVRARVPPLPQGGPVLIVFPRCAHYSLEWLAADDQRPAGSADGVASSSLSSHAGCGYDVISLDWGLEPADAVKRVNARCATAQFYAYYWAAVLPVLSPSPPSLIGAPFVSTQCAAPLPLVFPPKLCKAIWTPASCLATTPASGLRSPR